MKRLHKLKSPGLLTGALQSEINFDYLPAVASCEEMVVKVLLSCEPSVLTTVMMATEMPAAIRPYSIAVAPDTHWQIKAAQAARARNSAPPARP
jgi:hypothetical protein